MAHKTQLELNDDQYDFLIDVCSRQGKTLTSVIHEIINEKKTFQHTKSKPVTRKSTPSTVRALMNGRDEILASFDDFLYGK